MSEHNGQTYPLRNVIKYEFPARGDMPPLTFHWYDAEGQHLPGVGEQLRELIGGHPLSRSGVVMVGDKGRLFAPGHYSESRLLLPEETYEDYEPPTPWLPRSPGHKQEWMEAIRRNRPELAMSNFSYAGPLTETILLSDVAMRAGKKIHWDGPNVRVTNDEKANRFITREYRKGWKL